VKRLKTKFSQSSAPRGEIVLLHSHGKCRSCRFWVDDIAERQDMEVYGECNHPNIKEMLARYTDTTCSKYSPEPVATLGKFGCTLWQCLSKDV
jgi:hypothetical protein